ncbi:hypothetical protein OR16_04602 [Cupriavidus basilensis OR16]|uniref:Uncharacterized protein n=1 Tax=Cupriavidus basilensis OR16 TaxID=1127483 RepID=H1S012_9BURK|nr:hypothetical protein [Cupriavidus basilensis]EHP44228.1 hypothetical protein OR16_04602 [Cupriavidus basilensis OR16]
MSIPPRPKTQPITHHVPEHLVEAFLQAADEFFAQARGGRTAGQGAAEVRAQDRDRGLDSLAHLVEVAEGDTGQAGIVARFLAGLYNGTNFPFDLTELRGLDADLFEHCLAVLRLDNRPKVEVHRYFTDGDELWQCMIARWNLDQQPPAEPAPLHGERYQAKYVTHGNAPGYRDVTLYVSLENDPARLLPIELHFSAQDGVAIAQDVIGIHRRVWQDGRVPIDIDAGETRPSWF